MGTRVDFYVGRGTEAEWLGSYPFDGYPHGVFADAAGMFAAPPPTEDEWRQWVARFLEAERDKATTPDMGWPWPWEDSRTTDYAYAWDGGIVFGSCFGHSWFQVDPEAEDWGESEDDTPRDAIFPDMSSRKAVTYGARSGLIVVSYPADAG